MLLLNRVASSCYVVQYCICYVVQYCTCTGQYCTLLTSAYSHTHTHAPPPTHTHTPPTRTAHARTHAGILFMPRPPRAHRIVAGRVAVYALPVAKP